MQHVSCSVLSSAEDVSLLQGMESEPVLQAQGSTCFGFGTEVSARGPDFSSALIRLGEVGHGFSHQR